MTEDKKVSQDSFGPWREWQENWLKPWMEASQKQMEEWAKLWSFPVGGGKDFYSQWMNTVKGMVEKINQMEGRAPLGPEVFAKAFNSSQMFMKLLEFWGRMTSPVLPYMSGKQDPEKMKQAFDQWMEEYQKMMTTLWGFPPDSSQVEMIKTGTQMFKNSIEAAFRFWSPVLENIEQMPKTMEKAMQGDQTGILEMYGLLRKNYEDSFGKLLRLPTMGFFRETIERLSRSIDSFIEFMVILNEYHSMFYQTGMRAAEKVYGRLGEFGEEDWSSPEGFRKFYRLWWTINEDAYHELFMSPEFTNMLKQVLDRGLLFRRWMDAFTDKMLEVTNIPTRKDMDEIYQALYELKKEVRWQRRAIKNLESSTPSKHEE
jgi:class III poly(R)-hydroxyalkanoic acid synthase PhaE subunit